MVAGTLARAQALQTPRASTQRQRRPPDEGITNRCYREQSFSRHVGGVRIAFTPNKPTWKGTSLDQIITRVASPLLAYEGGHGWPAGTACLIAPFMAVTARHAIVASFQTAPHATIQFPRFPES
jgi:hypothetical protein